MIIIHGDHTIKSRERLLNLKAGNAAKEIISLVAGYDLNQIIQTVESQSLFNDDRLTVIENFFSSTKQKKQDDILAYLKKQTTNPNIIIWEGKQIDGRVLKSFSAATIELYKLDTVLFKLLEAVKPLNTTEILALLQQVVKKEPVELVFFMLVRHMRMLLAIKSQSNIPETMHMQPWLLQKAKTQASAFSLPKLQALYSSLFEIDARQKKGALTGSLHEELDFLISTL